METAVWQVVRGPTRDNAVEKIMETGCMSCLRRTRHICSQACSLS